MPERTLGLFAKRPVAGEVKTRLAAETSPEWAAQVADAFLHDCLDRFGTVHADRILAYAPDDAGTFFANVVSSQWRLTPQGDGDLGVRMARFYTREMQAGAQRIVLLGADSPTLPLSFIEQAFAELERADVVIGPATDGGYYLLGCTRRLPPIFEGITWGSGDVLTQTIQRLGDARLALLPPWYDVDTLEDWRMLQGHLAAMRRAGIDPGLPRTSKLGGTP